MRILVINPNTSRVVTDILEVQARRWAHGKADIVAVTAPFGAPALQSQSDLDVAARAVVEVVSNNPGFDAAIIGAFGDPGLDVVAAITDMPIFGMGRSGMLEAARDGRQFSIVTLGASMKPSIERAAASLGLANQLASIRLLDASILDIANHRSRFLAPAAQLANDCATEDCAQTILFGGAPFSGIGAEIGDLVRVPVLDGFSAALKAAIDLHR